MELYITCNEWARCVSSLLRGFYYRLVEENSKLLSKKYPYSQQSSLLWSFVIFDYAKKIHVVKFRLKEDQNHQLVCCIKNQSQITRLYSVPSKLFHMIQGGPVVFQIQYFSVRPVHISMCCLPWVGISKLVLLMQNIIPRAGGGICESEYTQKRQIPTFCPTLPFPTAPTHQLNIDRCISSCHSHN